MVKYRSGKWRFPRVFQTYGGILDANDFVRLNDFFFNKHKRYYCVMQEKYNKKLEKFILVLYSTLTYILK